MDGLFLGQKRAKRKLSQNIGPNAFGNPLCRLMDGVVRQMGITGRRLDIVWPSSLPITGRVSPSASARDAKVCLISCIDVQIRPGEDEQGHIDDKMVLSKGLGYIRWWFQGLHYGQESPYILSGLTSVGSYMITVLGAANRLYRKAFVQGVTMMRKTMATPHSARPRPPSLCAVISSITL